MKKKILITVVMCLVLAFSLALAISAEECESCVYKVSHETYYDIYTCDVCGTTVEVVNSKYVADVNTAINTYLNTNPSSFLENEAFNYMSSELQDVYYSYDKLGIADTLLDSAKISFEAGSNGISCDGENHIFEPSGNGNQYYTEYICVCGAGNFAYYFDTTIADDVASAWDAFIGSYVGTDEELQGSFDTYIQENYQELYNALYSIDAQVLNQLVGEISSAYLDGLASADDNSTELENKYNEGYEQGKIDGVQEFMSSSTYNDILAEEYNEGFEAGEISGVNDFKESTEYSQSLSEQYDKGVTEGVAEFKSSDNYKNALNERYSTGYKDGIAYYKTSTEYTKALDTQYDLGKSVAVSEYVNTDEYKAILSSEYDRGYDDGVSDTEIAEEENGSNVGTVLAIVGAVMFIGLGVSLFIPKKKRGRK